MAASDLFNLVACVAAVRDGVVPRQAETRRPDPACDLNLVRAESTYREAETAVAHSYSYFGGNAAAVVVQRHRAS